MLVMTGKKSENLCFFTSSFPYGYGETFIESEITYLAQSFKKIYLFPLCKKDHLRKLPDNVEVVFFKPVSKRKKVYSSLLNGVFLINVVLRESISSGNFKNFRYRLSLFLKYSVMSKDLKLFLSQKKVKNILIYSYWFDEWATVLAIAKKRSVIDYFVCRSHGFDLYNYRSSDHYFRFFQMKFVDKVYAISQDGCNHLKDNFPSFSYKIDQAYLGSNDYEIGNLVTDEDIIKVISISKVNTNKRVHLIVEALIHCKKDIEWTLIGDGPQINYIKNKIKFLPKNVKVNLLGNLENSIVLDYLSKNYIDALINVSESEGLPFTMMEAISFGIPIIGTNVGGVKEIINNYTGILLEKDFEIKSLSSLIDNLRENQITSLENRKLIRDFWHKKFQSSNNYKKFIYNLKRAKFDD